MARRFILGVLAFCTWVGIVHAVGRLRQLVWVNEQDNEVWRSNIDPSRPLDRARVGAMGGSTPTLTIAADPIDHQVYWADAPTFTIARINANAHLQGDVTEVLSDSPRFISRPIGLTVDWLRRRFLYADTRTLYTIPIDGDPYVFSRGIYHSGDSYTAVTYDGVADLVYWADSVRQSILRADANDSSVVTTVAPVGAANVVSMVLDHGGEVGWVYFADASTLGSIKRALIGDLRPNFGGDGVQTLYSWRQGLVLPRQLAIDDEERMLFFTDIQRNGLDRGAIHRLDLKVVPDLIGDGNVADLVEFVHGGIPSPGGLAIMDVTLNTSYIVRWPSDGQTLYNGSDVDVWWDATQPAAQATTTVKLVLYTNSTVHEDIARVPNTGVYRWRVPQDLPSGHRYRIMVVHPSQPILNGITELYLGFQRQPGVLNIFWTDPELKHVTWTRETSVQGWHDRRLMLEGFAPVSIALDEDGGTFILLEDARLILAPVDGQTMVSYVGNDTSMPVHGFTSGVEVLTDAIVNGSNVVFCARDRLVFWTEREDVKMLHIDTRPVVVHSVQSFLSTTPIRGVFRPLYLAIDELNRVVYYTDWVSRSIHRCGYDGSGLENVYEDLLTVPRGLALAIRDAQILFLDELSDVLIELPMYPTSTPANDSLAVIRSLPLTASPTNLLLHIETETAYFLDQAKRALSRFDYVRVSASSEIMWSNQAGTAPISRPLGLAAGYRIPTPVPVPLPSPSPIPVEPAVPIQDQLWFQALVGFVALCVVLAVLWGLWKLLKLVKRLIGKGLILLRDYLIRKGILNPRDTDNGPPKRVIGSRGKAWKAKLEARRLLRGYDSKAKQVVYELRNGQREYDPKTLGYRTTKHPVRRAADRKKLTSLVTPRPLPGITPRRMEAVVPRSSPKHAKIVPLLTVPSPVSTGRKEGRREGKKEDKKDDETRLDVRGPAVSSEESGGDDDNFQDDQHAESKDGIEVAE